MYYCTDCKERFEEPNKIQEPHHEIDAPFSETFGICPYCGSGDYEELAQCDICKEFYIEEENCECNKDVWDELNQVVDGLCKRYNCTRKDLTSVIEIWLENL